MRPLATLSMLAVITAGSMITTSRPADALSSRFGCYRVTAGALNIRERAWSRSKVVGVARHGEKLAKRRRFCAWRGYWCPVRTEDGISGWVDKRHIRRAPC